VRRAGCLAAAGIVLAAAVLPAFRAAADEASSAVQDPIAGFTFAAGTPARYAPGEPLRIRRGQTVVWTNLDPVPHDVSFTDGAFGAYLPAGASTQRTFDQPGRFAFACLQHEEFPSMHGLVYVE